MDDLLYFPYITLPKTAWLYKSLLYWDTVDTITPETYLRNPRHFDGTHMNELLEAELVRPVLPMNYIYDIPDFKKDFLHYVDEEYTPKKEFYKRKNGELVNTTKVHLEKIDDLGYKLVDRGLAHFKNDWFLMHQSVANDFMFYLASLIGKMRESQPITDNALNIKTKMHFGTQQQQNFLNREGIRRTVLNHVFPTPIEIGSVQELYDFKQKNENRLKRFRKHIEKELLHIDAAPGHMSDELLENFLKEIEEEKQSISSKMQEKWRVFDAATLIQLTASGTTMTNAALTGTNLAIGAAALSITGTLITTMKKMGKNETDVLSNPIAYAFLVEREWSASRKGKVLLKPNM